MIDEQYVKDRLGDKLFGTLNDFYKRVYKEQKMAYKTVCLTKRTFDLMYLFGKLPGNRPINNLCSFTSAMELIPFLGDRYMNYNNFPNIIFVEDLLWHGKTINECINTFFKKLNKYLKDNGCDKCNFTIFADFIDSIGIETAIQNESPSILMPQYTSKLYMTPKRADLYSLRSHLSADNHLSYLFYDNSYNIMGNEFSFKKDSESNKIIVEKIVNQTIKSGFKNFKGAYGEIFGKPVGNGFLTLELVNDILVPKVIFPNFNEELLKHASSTLGVNKNILSPEIVMTILGHNLLVDLAGKAGCSNDLPKSLTNLDRLQRIFDKDLITNLSKKTKTYIDIESLAKFTLGDNSINTTNSNYNNSLEYLADIIYKDNIESENINYRIYRGYKQTTDEDGIPRHHSFSALMNLATQKMSAYEFLHNIFLLESRGYITTNYELDNNYKMFYEILPEILLIEPYKHWHIMTVLSKIEIDHSWQKDRIKRFILNNPELFNGYESSIEEIISFVENVYANHLTISALLISFTPNFFRGKKLIRTKDKKSIMNRYLDDYQDKIVIF